MFKKLMVGCMLVFVCASSAFADREIRKITPPDLSTAHLGQKILCYRPMRHGAPRMEVEVRGEKVIAHNYGHGGSGWTLAPGSASYVNGMLIDNHRHNLTFETPITIIGGGVLGLMSAYDLAERGYNNITIIASKFEYLTSHNAGGLLSPVSMDNDPKMNELVERIGVDAYKFYSSIALGTHKNFKNGAKVVPGYFANREDAGLEPYVGKVMKPAKDVTLDFGNGTKRDMVAYDDDIFIDTAVMMKNLHRYLEEHNVSMIEQYIESFDQIDSRIVINCSGLGARELNGDKDLVPVEGHLIMLKDQKPDDLQYMVLIYLDEGKAESGHNIARSFYMFPKRLSYTHKNDVGVLGGTFIEGADEGSPNMQEFDTIVKNSKEFYGIK